MGSPLNKNHPFRASITHDGPSAGSFGASESAPARGHDSRDNDSSAPLTRKLKIVAAGSALVAIYYVFSSAAGMFMPSAAPEKQLAKEAPQESIAQDVEEDWAYQEDSGGPVGNRSVDEARDSAGLFGRLFCRGGRRSTFCD